MARATRNAKSDFGTRLPNSVNTPTAKAISVAIGMPQPRMPAPPALKTVYISAGAAMPPKIPDQHLPFYLQAHDEEK